MRVTALGVNAAFSVGSYEDGVSLPEIEKAFTDGKTLEDIYERIKSGAEKFYRPSWQSNFLLEFDTANKRGKKGEPYRLLLDCGCDARHGLAALGLTFLDIDGVYISHPHSDHIGGLECFALMTIFAPGYSSLKTEWLEGKFIITKLLEKGSGCLPPEFTKPDLFIHPKVLTDVRFALQPGLDSLQGLPEVILETYFNVVPIGRGLDRAMGFHEFNDGSRVWKMTPIFSLHVLSSREEMPCYGIVLETNDESTFLLFPTDTQHLVPPQLVEIYRRADVIYMDCETSTIPSGVHPNISDLIDKMSPSFQKKCYLYHYDELPQYPEGMFKGTLRACEWHEY